MSRDPMNLEAAYDFAVSHGLAAEVQEIKLWRVSPGLPKYGEGQVRKHLLVDLFTVKDLMTQFRLAHWHVKNPHDRIDKLREYKEQFANNEAAYRLWPPSWRRK